MTEPSKRTRGLQAGLHALLRAVAQSPIFVCRLGWRTLDWARIRNSPDVDQYVLAWIASHVTRRDRTRRPLM
ncbi:MAG: hypothetical protein IT537_01180 [Hyphomicrobiales bacterium]|nr:hypothetical protein [Hyphomicrobiales bacterium]